ncbi:MAG: flavodoxin family protein [Desulfofustis sp.]|nr:flavodoxin family protein [Desulfofustis sp.]
MKSLIVYSSKSGNTKRLAKAVRDFLPGEKVMKAVEENPGTDGFDFICVGFWFMGGKADDHSARFLKSLDGQQPLFLFATHGAAAESDHVISGMESAKKLVPHAIIETFSCQGEVNAEFLAKARTMNPVPVWVGDAANAAGHPDAADIKRLHRILEKAVGKIPAAA